MRKDYICVICPNGCDIAAHIEGTEVLSLEGARCHQGENYAREELTSPRRTIATSILVEGGDLPLVSVRLTGPIPKARIFDVMAEIRPLRVRAPLSIGDVLIHNVLGLGCDVIATKRIQKE